MTFPSLGSIFKRIKMAEHGSSILLKSWSIPGGLPVRHHAKSAEIIHLAEKECSVERGSEIHAANGERPYLCGVLPGVWLFKWNINMIITTWLHSMQVCFLVKSCRAPCEGYHAKSAENIHLAEKECPVKHGSGNARSERREVLSLRRVAKCLTI